MTTKPPSSKTGSGATMPTMWVWILGVAIGVLILIFAFIVLNLPKPWATIVAAGIGLLSMGCWFYLESPDRKLSSSVWGAGGRSLTGALAVFSLCLPLVDLFFDGGKVPDLCQLQLHEWFVLGLLGVMIFVILACIVFPLKAINKNIRASTPRPPLSGKEGNQPGIGSDLKEQGVDIEDDHR